MKKYKIGDELMVYGPYHLEKAKIEKVTKRGTMLLNNQMEINPQTLEPVNCKSALTVTEFDQGKYDYLFSQSMMEKKLFVISSKFRKLGERESVEVYKKLNKLVEKYF